VAAVMKKRSVATMVDEDVDEKEEMFPMATDFEAPKNDSCLVISFFLFHRI
jgi:hypothetical protein